MALKVFGTAHSVYVFKANIQIQFIAKQMFYFFVLLLQITQHTFNI